MFQPKEYLYFFELIGGGAVAALAFLGKRTLNDYDKRIEKVEKKAEKKEDRVMSSLNAIDIKLERLATIIEERTEKKH